MSPEAFGAAVADLTANVSTMTLATCRDDRPRATDVYFAALGFDLVFFSSPSAEHSRNLAANPRCSATIHPVVSGWKEIRGLRVDGVVRTAADDESSARALRSYLAKFPFAAQFLASPLESLRALRSATLYVLAADRLTYIDNALGFGVEHWAPVDRGALAGRPERT